MTKVIQLSVDDYIKETADDLFASLGIDTTTAIKIFLIKAIQVGGFPFEVTNPNRSLQQAMDDVINKKNLHGPYKTAKDAIDAMLND